MIKYLFCSWFLFLHRLTWLGIHTKRENPLYEELLRDSSIRIEANFGKNIENSDNLADDCQTVLKLFQHFILTRFERFFWLMVDSKIPIISAQSLQLVSFYSKVSDKAFLNIQYLILNFCLSLSVWPLLIR